MFSGGIYLVLIQDFLKGVFIFFFCTSGLFNAMAKDSLYVVILNSIFW